MPPQTLGLNWGILTLMLLAPRLHSHLKAHRRTDASAVKDHAENSSIIVGLTDMSAHYIRTVKELQFYRQKILSIVDQDPELLGKSVHGCTVVGSPDRLESIVREYTTHGVNVDRIIIADLQFAPGTEGWGKLRVYTDKVGCKCEHIEESWLILFSSTFRDENLNVSYGNSDNALQNDRYRDRYYDWSKRTFDIIASILLIIALSPFMITSTFIVFLDLGIPVLFWQQRMGLHGFNFRLYKFRTLQGPLDSAGRVLSDEQRLTSVGRFLRARRLDELPQLFNVLRGDMSLVGPRPLLPIDQPKDWTLRLAMRPGITGWAQVNGGKLLTVDEKVCLDEYYVQNANFLLDIKILILTVVAVFVGDRRNERVISASLPEPVETHQREGSIEMDTVVSP